MLFAVITPGIYLRPNAMNWQSLTRKKDISLAVETEGAHSLRRSLRLADLTGLGIAAIIGAGIFSTIGNAAAAGGPAIALLFIFTALACCFAALCYAEFASRIPIAGSAYTYAYVSFGELFAWIIGWDLVLEYAIGNIAVAISWSGYFTGLLQGIGIHFPYWLQMDYLTAYRSFTDISSSAGKIELSSLAPNLREAYLAWTTAPQIGSLRIIADLPALGIVVLITALVYVGIRESRIASNVLVGLKLLIILAVIVVGFFYIQPENWSPFAPQGFGGVMSGVAAVFFAYIGFDAISTTSEEAINPRRDMPKSILLSLLVCTVLYVLIALVLTGMVPYMNLGVDDPVAFVFTQVGLDWFSYVIAVSAIVAMASVLLVFQLGQPRIWMSMGRDGLLPPIFARVHPRFKTPSFATILTGFLVAIPALFMNLTEVTDLGVIGTLFAFILVCGGVALNHYRSVEHHPGAFKVPYFSSRWVIPFLTVAGILLVAILGYDNLALFFGNKTLTANGAIPGGATQFIVNLPYWVFMVSIAAINYLCIRYRLSLIPMLGVLSCLYLMTELGHVNWMRFGIWLVIGLAVYFGYSRRHSKLRAMPSGK